MSRKLWLLVQPTNDWPEGSFHITCLDCWAELAYTHADVCDSVEKALPRVWPWPRSFNSCTMKRSYVEMWRSGRWAAYREMDGGKQERNQTSKGSSVARRLCCPSPVPGSQQQATSLFRWTENHFLLHPFQGSRSSAAPHNWQSKYFSFTKKNGCIVLSLVWESQAEARARHPGQVLREEPEQDSERHSGRWLCLANPELIVRYHRGGRLGRRVLKHSHMALFLGSGTCGPWALLLVPSVLALALSTFPRRVCSFNEPGWPQHCRESQLSQACQLLRWPHMSRWGQHTGIVSPSQPRWPAQNRRSYCTRKIPQPFPSRLPTGRNRLAVPGRAMNTQWAQGVVCKQNQLGGLFLSRCWQEEEADQMTSKRPSHYSRILCSRVTEVTGGLK